MKRKVEMEEDPARANLHETGKQRFRRIPPSHYTVKIESFSSLLDSQFEKYETKYFEAGGYKWRLVLYPNGNKKEEGDQRHISLFLSIVEPDDFALGLEVNANVNFSVFDGIRDRFLVIQDADDNEWRYHKMKTEWDFAKLLPHDVLKNPLNGYVVNDCCTLGVEVFVVKTSFVGESLSLVKEPKNGLYTWKIINYSALDKIFYYSDVFTVEGREWKLKLYPKGVSSTAGAYLSLFLILDESETLGSGRKLYAEYLMRIKNHKNCEHYEKTGGKSAFNTLASGGGWSEFMLLSTLKDPSKGYLVDDCVIIEAKINLVFAVKDFA